MLRSITIITLCITTVISSAQNHFNYNNFSYTSFPSDSIGFETGFIKGNLFFKEQDPILNIDLKYIDRSQSLYVKSGDLIYEINTPMTNKFELFEQNVKKTYQRGFTYDDAYKNKVSVLVSFKTEPLSNQQMSKLSAWIFSFEDVEINYVSLSGKKNKLKGIVNAQFYSYGVFNRYVKELSEKPEIKDVKSGDYFEAETVAREKSQMIKIDEFKFLEVLADGQFKLLKAYRYLDVTTSGPLNSMKSEDQRAIREYFITNGRSLTPIKLNSDHVLNYIVENTGQNIKINEYRDVKGRESSIAEMIIDINSSL